jgi:hypothetical protein
MAKHEERGGERAGERGSVGRRPPGGVVPAGSQRHPQVNRPDRGAQVPWEGHVGHELDGIVDGRSSIHAADRRLLLRQPKEPSLD